MSSIQREESDNQSSDIQNIDRPDQAPTAATTTSLTTATPATAPAMTPATAPAVTPATAPAVTPAIAPAVTPATAPAVTPAPAAAHLSATESGILAIKNALAGKVALAELGMNWPIVIWIGIVHVMAIAALFFFSWPAFIACVVLAFATGSFGVCMGYHRLLTHQSFQTYRPIRWLLAFLGGLSGEGSALTWVAQHRKHHAFSDHDGDPHSPKDGGWWSHLLWFMPDFGKKWHGDLLQRYAPDILKDKMMVIIHHLFLPSHLMLGAGLFLLGYFGPASWGLGSAWAGASMLFWGLGVRMVYVLHITWFVNSATHLWGYRNYETSDDSRNLWWVGILAWGEGWHNNHHAYQRVASQGHRWWEIDMTYWAILLMEKLGLAWNVVRLNDVRKALPQ